MLAAGVVVLLSATIKVLMVVSGNRFSSNCGSLKLVGCEVEPVEWDLWKSLSSLLVVVVV